MKRFLTLLLVMILTLSLTACGTDPQGSVPSDSSDDHSDPAQTQGSAEEIIQGKEYLKTYKTSFSSSYPSFNYFSTAYGTVRGIVANCIDGLVEPDIYGVYVPSMAESWTVNSDQTVWTFKIRKGVNWVDHTGADTGMSVTAQDFVGGIRYIGDPLNGAYSLRVIRNLITGLYDYYWTLDDIDSGLIIDQTREDVVAQFDQMVGVKALDEYTVEYTLTSSAPTSCLWWKAPCCCCP